jgi:hypothetical protein
MSMIDQFSSLLVEQQRHDDLAHRDILCLPVQDRIRHMVLHFAKYCGHFADIQSVHSDERFISTFVDTTIICLASANALGIKLTGLVKDQTSHADWATKFKTQTGISQELSRELFVRLSKITGTMAKACESLDHLESFDYRGTLERGVVAIASLCAVVADRAGVDLPTLVRARWDQIERKFLPTQEVSSSGRNETLRLAKK